MRLHVGLTKYYMFAADSVHLIEDQQIYKISFNYVGTKYNS